MIIGLIYTWIYPSLDYMLSFGVRRVLEMSHEEINGGWPT